MPLLTANQIQATTGSSNPTRIAKRVRFVEQDTTQGSMGGIIRSLTQGIGSGTNQSGKTRGHYKDKEPGKRTQYKVNEWRRMRKKLADFKRLTDNEKVFYQYLWKDRQLYEIPSLTTDKWKHAEKEVSILYSCKF